MQFRSRFLLALTFVFGLSSAALCQDVDELFDPADTTSAVDLAKTPLAVDLLRSAMLSLQDAGIKKQFNNEFQNLQREIGESVSDPSVGCLLKVRMFVSPEGAIAIPGGILIAFEGTGKNPIDALVGVRRTGALVADQPLSSTFENQSYYIWIKKERGVLKAGHMPRESREKFEKLAEQEFYRRRNLGDVDLALKSSGLAMVSRDQYWAEMARRHLAVLRDDAERRQVQDLVQQFADAQRRFNEAYDNYQQLVQEMAEQRRHIETLETLSRIVGAVSTAIEIGKMTPSNNSNASVTAPSSQSPSPTSVMIEYHEKQVNVLTGSAHEWDGQIQIRGATLKQANDELVKAFQGNGIKIPDADRKLVLPPKP